MKARKARRILKHRAGGRERRLRRRHGHRRGRGRRIGRGAGEQPPHGPRVYRAALRYRVRMVLLILISTLIAGAPPPPDTVSLPAITFPMGSTRQPDEQPVHEVSLPAFR